MTGTMTQYRQKGEIGDEKDREREGRIGGKETVLYWHGPNIYNDTKP